MFNPKTLLLVSKNLLKESTDSNFLRTVLNRSYYSCFMEVRKRKGKVKSDEWLTHGKAWKSVNEKNKGLGSKLDLLFAFRKIADYSLESEEKVELRSGAKEKVKIDRKTAENSITLAENFLEGLKAINLPANC